MSNRAEYRAAIALNNIGVSLLERGAQKNAIDTLKDAIAVMRHVFPDETPTCARKDIDGMLERACKKLSAPEVVCSWFKVQSVSYGEPSTLAHLKTASRLRPTGQAFYPVRIEVTDSADEPRDVDLESGILLYNFGLAHILLSHIVQKAAGRYRSGAMKVLDLAHAILTNRSKSCEDPFQQVQLVFVTLLVLSSIVQVLQEEGQFQQAEIALDRLDRVEAVADELTTGELDLFNKQSIISAAAA